MQSNQWDQQSYFQFFWTHLWPQLIQPSVEIECKHSERGVESVTAALKTVWGTQSWYFIPIACTTANYAKLWIQTQKVG